MRALLVLTPISLLAVAASLTPSSAQNADTTNQTQIDISFDGIEDMVRPFVRDNIAIHHELTITLSGRNQVSERHVWHSGQRNQSQRATALGLKGEATWRVLPGNELLRVEEFRQSTERIVISTSNGKCTATVTDRMKPGLNEYAFKSWSSDEVNYFSRREITSSSC